MYCLLLWKIYTPLLPGFWRLGIITSASILVYSQAFMVPSVNVISTQHLLHLAPYRHTPTPCFTVFFSLGHHPQRSFTLSELSQETQISIDNPCAKSEALACLLSSVILWDHSGRTFCCFDYRNYSSSRTSRLQLCFHLCILVKSQ